MSLNGGIPKELRKEVNLFRKDYQTQLAWVKCGSTLKDRFACKCQCCNWENIKKLSYAYLQYELFCKDHPLYDLGYIRIEGLRGFRPQNGPLIHVTLGTRDLDEIHNTMNEIVDHIKYMTLEQIKKGINYKDLDITANDHYWYGEIDYTQKLFPYYNSNKNRI